MVSDNSIMMYMYIAWCSNIEEVDLVTHKQLVQKECNLLQWWCTTILSQLVCVVHDNQPQAKIISHAHYQL